MKDSYLNNQNISNNIIINKPNFKFHVKQSSMNRDSLESYTSCDGDKYETIDNRINDSLSSNDFEEMRKQEEDIDHLDKFHKDNNITSNCNKQNKNRNSINSNKKSNDSNQLNYLTSQESYNKPILGNILPLPRKTNIIVSNDMKISEKFGYKRSISGDRVTAKKTQSRFSSSSENKYNFAHVHRIDAPNEELENREIIYKEIHFPSHNQVKNNNIGIHTAKVTKLDQEPENKYNENRNLPNKNFYHSKNNNIQSLTNFHGNQNIRLNLSPNNKNHIFGVKKIIKKNSSDKNNKFVKKNNNEINTIIKSNSNNMQIQENNKAVKTDDINDENKLRNNYSKNKSQFTLIQESKNYSELSGENKSIVLKSSKKKVPLDDKNSPTAKKINNDFKQHSISPKQLENNTLNKDNNSNTRLTVVQEPSPELENNNLKQQQNLIIQGQNQKINLNQNLQEFHNLPNSPRGAVVTKLPPLSTFLNMKGVGRNPNFRDRINQINRNSVSPNGVNINDQSKGVMNNLNNIKAINNMGNINKMTSKNNMITMNKMNPNNMPSTNGINYIDNINSLNTMNNMNNINKVNSIINMNSLNNINNLNNQNHFNNMNKINNINKLNNKNNLNIRNNMINMNNMNFINNINNNINSNNMNNINNRIIQNQNNISMGMQIQNNNLSNIHFKNSNHPNISNQLINNAPINQMINQTQNSPRNIQQNQALYNPKINPLISQNQQLNSFMNQNNQRYNSQQNQIINQIQNNIQNHIQANPNQPNSIQNQILPKSQIINQSPISVPQENDINNNINKVVSEKNEINEEGDIKKDISVRYNSFDPSGWIKNYGVLTLPGKDTSGSQKTNQDSFVFKTGINQIKDFNIFGVLDGHGPEGHFVSKFASEFLPSKLINHPEIKSLKDPEEIYKKLKENNCYIITQVFIETDNQLKNVDFDAYESGCTCVLVIHIGSHIICANTGDSRSVVVYDEQGGNNLNYYNVAALSKDYKPELPEETQRIMMSGGEVRQMKNEMGEGVGPFRVWALDGNYPGLAMSRSIGDLKGKKIGVIPDPGILEYDLCENTKYIVACSDGVWEFLNNDEVKEIGKKYYAKNDPSGFCHELVDQSLNLWEANDIVVDDITAVVAFF